MLEVAVVLCPFGSIRNAKLLKRARFEEGEALKQSVEAQPGKSFWLLALVAFENQIEVAVVALAAVVVLRLFGSIRDAKLLKRARFEEGEALKQSVEAQQSGKPLEFLTLVALENQIEEGVVKAVVEVAAVVVLPLFG
jgi:hypothetical protein